MTQARIRVDAPSGEWRLGKSRSTSAASHGRMSERLERRSRPLFPLRELRACRDPLARRTPQGQTPRSTCATTSVATFKMGGRTEGLAAVNGTQICVPRNLSTTRSTSYLAAFSALSYTVDCRTHAQQAGWGLSFVHCSGLWWTCNTALSSQWRVSSSPRSTVSCGYTVLRLWLWSKRPAWTSKYGTNPVRVSRPALFALCCYPIRCAYPIADRLQCMATDRVVSLISYQSDGSSDLKLIQE
jgi:hypothetical protein